MTRLMAWKVMNDTPTGSRMSRWGSGTDTPKVWNRSRVEAAKKL